MSPKIDRKHVERSGIRAIGRWRASIPAVVRAGSCACLLAMAPTGGRSAEVDRTRLDRVLSVLREVPSDASAACLASMRAVHGLERRRADAPEQLEFAYQNASQLCGADAERVCRTTAAMMRRDVCRILDAPP